MTLSNLVTKDVWKLILNILLMRIFICNLALDYILSLFSTVFLSCLTPLWEKNIDLDDGMKNKAGTGISFPAVSVRSCTAGPVSAVKCYAEIFQVLTRK